MFNTVQHFRMVMRSSHGSSGPLMVHQVLSLVIMSIMSFMSRQMSHVTSKNGQKWEGQIFFSNLTIPPIVFYVIPTHFSFVHNSEVRAHVHITLCCISEHVRPSRNRCRSSGHAGGQKMEEPQPQRQCYPQVQICQHREKC